MRGRRHGFPATGRRRVAPGGRTGEAYRDPPVADDHVRCGHPWWDDRKVGPAPPENAGGGYATAARVSVIGSRVFEVEFLGAGLLGLGRGDEAVTNHVGRHQDLLVGKDDPSLKTIYLFTILANLPASSS